MDSSRYNPIYCQWNAPYSSHPPPAHVLPPPPPLPPPPRPSHPESPNLFGRLSQIGGQHQDYHHYSHRQDLPREPAVNQTQPSSYYSQQPQPQPQSHQQHLQYIPQQVTYETQRISEPSSAIQCTESRDIAQSAWVGYKEKLHDLWTVDAGQGRRDAGRSRVDPGTDRNHQYGYGRSARDSSGVSIDRGLDGTSRSRDEFLRLGYERKQSAATRIEGNCQDRGQLKSQSGRYFRGLGEGNRVSAPSVGYGSDRRGVTVSRDVSRSSAPYDGARNQRWDEAGRTFYPRKKDNYYHSEIEQCFDRGRKEESNELNPTPKKQMQKKSALLRLETPRSYQNSRENDRSWYHSYYCKRKFNTNSFKGKEYLGLSDHGFVEKQRGRTPMDLDVTFKSNVLVAKPVASPTSGGICSDIFVTPRSSKARRALVTDKNEKYSVTEGNGKLRTHFSDEVSVSEGSRQSTRQKIASEIEKKPDSHSNPSSSDSGGKLKKIKVVDNVIQDIKVKITDTGYQASIHDSEAKVHSSVHAAEKMFCEALKEAKDDFNVAQDSNMETCSIEEDVIDGDRIILKSHEDMFDRKGTGCNAGEALVPKVPEKEEIVKTPASWPTATYISRCSEGGIHFVGKSMWSVVSLPYEDEDMDCIPSPMMEVNIGSEERKSIGSSIGSLGYREKDFEKSSLDATTYFNSEEPGDQVFAKSYIGVSGGGNNGINKNVDFLAPENDTHSKGLVPISSLDVAYVSTDFANANSSVSGHLGNASNIVSGDLGNANSTVSEDLGNANSTVAMDLANANSTVSGDLANANSTVSGDLANANSTVAGDLANANSTVSGDLANANSFPVGICTKTIVKSPDTSVVFEVENKNTQCENVNPSVKNENFGRKEFMETTSLYSAAETADNLYSDESKQTFVNGTSSSLTKVAVKGSSTVLPMERIDGCSRGDELDLAMAVPSEVCMEIVSTERLLPDEDPGLGSPHSAKIPHVHHQSSGLDSRGLKACLLEPNVSLSKDITYCASECLVKRDVSQNAYSFIDKLPSALGTNCMSCKETTTDAEAGLHETQPCSAVCKLLSEDHFECGSSGAVGSLRNHSLDINLEKGPSGVSSCLVSDCSVSPCQVSPLVTVNEQIQNKTSIQSSCSDSQASIMQKENNSAEKTKVDIQEEKIKPSSGTSEYRTLGIDAIAVSRESVFPCDSLSSSPSLSFRKIQSDLHVAAMVGETSQGKEKPKPTGGTSKYRALGTDIVTVRGDSVFPCDSLSKSPRQIRSEIHVASMVDETCKYKEKTKPSGGTSNYRIPETDSVAVSRGSVFTCDSLSSSPRLSIRKIRSEIHAAAVVDDSSKINGSQKGGSLLQEQIMTSCDVTQAGNSLAHYPYLGQTCLGTDVGSYVRPMSEYHGRYLVEKPNGYPIEKLTDITSDVGSQEKYSPDSAKTDIFEGEALSSDGKVSGTEIPRGSGVRVSRSHSHTDFQFALNQGKDHVVSVRHGDSQSKTSLSTRHDIEKRKEKSNHSTQKIYHRSLPFVSDTKKDANPPTHITKRHTWHRKSDISPCSFVPAKPMSSILSTEQKLPKVTAQPSSSYVRKGNSLLRKPLHDSPGVALGMPPSASQLNRLTAEDKSTRSASMVDIDNISFHVKTGEMLTLERQSKPHSDSSTSKISNAIATSGKCVLSYSMDHLATGLPESIMDSATSGEANVPHCGGDTFKTSDTLIQTGYASDCQQKSNPLKLDSANLKRMIYVKRKANQLVAASDMYGASKSHIPPSDGYFKRSKNQLVRNLESHVTQSISLPDDVLDSRAAANMVSERSSSSAFSDSAVMRPFKQSKFSLVWTQNDPQPRMPIAHMRYQKILPQLVPWKRVTYWRRLMNSVSAFRNGSFFNISRKLSMMRKRHTVYTRSTNGYSLRKSKVLSIGGSHLKWSKSIERDSQKANEEATLAVAAFTKKEREKHSGQSNTRKTSRNHLARERVFRFGSLRYKMDSSRRTLQRISDVDSRCSGPSKNGKGAKRPFIPKRLMIGNEEYVRVGNGNQLVRDPKKRIRVLANEKVRWSLHNVRLRLAKKKKYCQFFTRFGKCYKDDGKCPYVHDPSKIAVCTKFLNGSCVNENCKLTHKVIPERMPDCSYFLQGLCNNEKCPYRHVHVNPSAAICDGFLKGYCSDGDECRKKHSYTCPVFEATGSCSQGTKCKYHHPKNQSKGRKKKRPSEPSEKNACGRYFSSLHKVLSESEPVIVNRRSTDGEVFGMEGLDFIVLGDTEYEASDNNNPATKQSICSDSEAPVSIYNLIRPVALMQ